MADQFRNFNEMVRVCGKDSFRIETRDREAEHAIIAPHGGTIEPDTDVIARYIAGTDLKFYAFIGRLRKDQANQHLTSTNFDEPQGDALVRSSRIAVAIHGRRRGVGDADEISVGGGNHAVRRAVTAALNAAGFKTASPPPNLAGESRRNICNRCSEGGVQLELTRPLRQQLTTDARLLQRFAYAIRHGLGVP